MAKALFFHSLKRAASSLLKPPSSFLRPILQAQESILIQSRQRISQNLINPSWGFRNVSHGRVNLVISQGKPKEGKRRRREELLIEKDPRSLTVKRKKRQKFANVEERIKTKLERARIKEAKLVERLKRSSAIHLANLAMYKSLLREIARLSGGIPIQIIGDDTVIFYRGKNYVQPIVMSPVDTLSKKKALEKSKYEQSLETVRHFIAISEKELELYYRHNALYGDSNNRNPGSILDDPTRKDFEESGKPGKQNSDLSCNSFPPGLSEIKASATYDELSEAGDDSEDEDLSLSESDSEDEHLSDMADEESKDSSSAAKTSSSAILGSSSIL
ncbi:GROUP II INTRON SPLICING FACTOR CRS1-LIKE [Salix viminalis]|uniref:GROUP II INTRON SPLICING FACTOR CRS1-LIKE n=1 Tax=Salix viminalis TaxID=40686 RepID=A0A9Q0NX84_SALVM|nr:GROUP II INTRON SPLICING FACTOR CRS1-LIKE [Salix viminalis]